MFVFLSTSRAAGSKINAARRRPRPRGRAARGRTPGRMYTQVHSACSDGCCSSAWACSCAPSRRSPRTCHTNAPYGALAGRSCRRTELTRCKMRRSGDYVDSGEGWARPAGRGKAFVWLIRCEVGKGRRGGSSELGGPASDGRLRGCLGRFVLPECELHDWRLLLRINSVNDLRSGLIEKSDA
jgi:hypothetical protein